MIQAKTFRFDELAQLSGLSPTYVRNVFKSSQEYNPVFETFLKLITHSEMTMSAAMAIVEGKDMWDSIKAHPYYPSYRYPKSSEHMVEFFTHVRQIQGVSIRELSNRTTIPVCNLTSRERGSRRTNMRMDTMALYANALFGSLEECFAQFEIYYQNQTPQNLPTFGQDRKRFEPIRQLYAESHRHY